VSFTHTLFLFLPIPIDVGKNREAVAKEMNKACEDIGFMTVVGHGVPEDLVNRTWNVS
jgi:isopenicillin N synthase-like dioxygenase